MTWMSDGTYVTDLDNHEGNQRLTAEGYTVRHIETWHRDEGSNSFITWDTPQITEADLPY